MKNTFRKLLLCLSCLAFIFTAGCSADNSGGASGQTQEGTTFIPQEVQPIEENPYRLPMEISADVGLHKLVVQRPKMDDMTNSNDVIQAILGSANQVAKLQGEDLENNSQMESGGEQINLTQSYRDGYLEMGIQRPPDGFDDGNQDFYPEIWGGLSVTGLRSYISSAGDMNDQTNSAILFKHRFFGAIRGFQTGFNNGSVNIHIGISFDNHLYFDVGQDFMGYSAANNGEYVNSLNFLENEWYLTLVALDSDYGYRYITWQENDPTNHAFYAADLNAIFKPYGFSPSQDIWAGLNYFTQANGISVGIESLTVYEFENFNDVESVNLNTDPEIYTYADDDGKYQLAVQLFDAGNYYSAYTLFNELDGYETGDYLAECERLLQTVEIKNPYVAGTIKKALKDQGKPVYEYLYTYQVENFNSLDLSECRIEDLSFISNFANLEELNLNKNAVWDLAPLKDLQSLEKLSLGKNNISDITPLIKLSNLQYLDLNDNLIEDVAALNNLTSLKELNLSTNNIQTIDGLYNLKNLESLDLSYNLIPSISALEYSPLKSLNIMNTDINDLNAVADFTGLESLKAGFRYIWKGNRSYLLTKKYEIDDHFFMGLTGLDALVRLTNLKELYLSRLNEDGDTLEPIAGLTNLETLIFHQYSGASDPNVLGSLVNLKELVLDSWSIGFYDVSFLANLTRLEKLSIETFCYVEDLSVISGLPNLEELRMFKYGEDLSFLTGLKKLRLLELKNWDTVEDYTPLLALDNLEYLALQEMTVNDLSVISQLENLKYLRLDSPEINNIRDIIKLENLEYFLMQNSGVIGDSKPESFDRSLFNGLDHLKFASVGIRGENGFGYEFGDPEFSKMIEEPQDIGIEVPEFDYYWIDNPDSLKNLPDYVGSHHLVIDGLFSNFDENIKFILPRYVRNIYISSSADQPVMIELDASDNKGLERLVVGHIEVSRDDPDGFGQGNFTIENLDGLAGCTNLKEVYIESSRIDDISALASLDKLEVLELTGNNIYNVSALHH